MNEEQIKQLEAQVEETLMKMFATPVLNLQQLKQALNYSSTSAIRQAIMRGSFPIAYFQLSGRRGHFVLLSDVAKFIASQATKTGGKDEIGR